MSCSVEVLVVALQLARGLVVEPAYEVTRGSTFSQTLEYRAPVCTEEWGDQGGFFFRRYLTHAESLRCQADIAERKDAEARWRDADYKEFQRLAEMCGEPLHKRTGYGRAFILPTLR